VGVKTKYSSLNCRDPAVAEALLAWGRKSQFEQDSDWVLLDRIQEEFPSRSCRMLPRQIKLAAIWGTDRHLYIGWDTFRPPTHSCSDVKVQQQELLRDADIRTTMNVYTQAGQ
jgi:hypothetical protein